MKPFARLSLFGAGGLTLLLAPLVLGNLHPWGTRDGLAGIQWPLLCTPRWLCLAAALAAGLRAGRFDWVAARADVRTFVVMGAHLVVGVASLFCLVEMSETHPPVPLWLRGLAALVSLVVPAVSLAFLAAPRPADQAPPPLWRGLLVGCVVVGVAAGAAVLGREHLAAQEVRRREAVGAAEYQARKEAGLAQLAQLPADAPLERWLPFTRAGDTAPEVGERARDAIAARPHRTQELTALLRGPDDSTRALALDYLGFGAGVLPPLPDELLAPVRDALDATAASLRAQAEARPDLAAGAFDAPCLAALLLPQRFPGHEADFVKPVRALRAVLDRLPKSAEPTAAQQELDSWLGLHDHGRTR